MKTKLERLKEGQSIESIEQSLSERNQAFIQRFLTAFKGNVVPERLRKYRWSLIRFCDLIEKDLDELTLEECKQVNGVIKESDFSSKSKEDFIAEVRKAYKFLFGEDISYPKNICCLKAEKITIN